MANEMSSNVFDHLTTFVEIKIEPDSGDNRYENQEDIKTEPDAIDTSPASLHVELELKPDVNNRIEPDSGDNRYENQENIKTEPEAIDTSPASLHIELELKPDVNIVEGTTEIPQPQWAWEAERSRLALDERRLQVEERLADSVALIAQTLISVRDEIRELRSNLGS